jgi:hypothetical protein
VTPEEKCYREVLRQLDELRRMMAENAEELRRLRIEVLDVRALLIGAGFTRPPA